MTPTRASGHTRLVAVAAVVIALALMAAAVAVLFIGDAPPVEHHESAAVNTETPPAVAETPSTAIAASVPAGGERTEAVSDTDPFASGPLTSQAYEIVGKVVDSEHKPVNGASIQLYISPWPILAASMIPGFRENGVRIEEVAKKSGVDGAFRFRGPFNDGMDYFLVVKFPNRAPVVKRGFAVERGVRCDVGELTLEVGLGISGLVVGPTGAPVPNAHVGIVHTPSFWAVERFLEQSEPEEWATADAEGKFDVKHLTEGRYVVLAFAKGLARGATPPITLSREKESTPIVVNLAEGSSILGSVSRPEGGGIERAKVRVRLSKNPESGGITRGYRGPGVEVAGEDSVLCDYPISVNTDAAGQFVVEGLVAGSIYMVSATAEGFRKSGDQVVNSGHTNVTIALRPDFEIRGNVVDADSGLPIPGAHVSRYTGRLDELRRGASQFPTPEGTSDGQGKFTARDGGKAGASVFLAWFPLTGSVKNPGYSPTVSEAFTIVEGQPVPEITIKMVKGSAIAGSVVSGATGEPLASAALQLYSVRDPSAPNARPYSTGSFMGRATADARGKFAFEGLIPGFYMVEVREPSTGGNRSEAVNLGTADRRENMRIVVPIAGSIRGTIVNNGTLASVKVSATRTDGLAFTRFADSENRFALEKLPPGLYRVRAEKMTSMDDGEEGFGRRWGMQENSVTAELKDGQVLTLTLDIPDSSIGSLTGQVNDSDDVGAGYSVVAVRENSNQRGSLNSDGRDPRFNNFKSATADVNGVFEFVSLREGSYRLYAIPRGRGLTPKNAIASDLVQIFGNASARRDLFGRSGPLKGTVLRPTGQGFGGATVVATVNATRSPTPVLPAGTRFTTRSKNDGGFDFGKLPGGAYDVTVEQSLFPRKTVGAEIYGATTQPLQIVLDAPAKVKGQPNLKK